MDRLIGRDLGRFGAGHGDGFVHYHARRIISSSLIAKGLVWLAVPIFLVSEYVFIAAWQGLG
ncbi:hypothetical protein [Pantoea vagans]|uniref:hypothetical protein n=1 Tax=Pantoea vagans TaxID=470934 RepID=UPI003B01A45C